MFLDGITKSGGSNIRNSHLIASKEVIEFTQARASHEIIPSFHSQAVAIAAYEMGLKKPLPPSSSLPTRAAAL